MLVCSKCSFRSSLHDRHIKQIKNTNKQNSSQISQNSNNYIPCWAACPNLDVRFRGTKRPGTDSHKRRRLSWLSAVRHQINSPFNKRQTLVPRWVFNHKNKHHNMKLWNYILTYEGFNCSTTWNYTNVSMQSIRTTTLTLYPNVSFPTDALQWVDAASRQRDRSIIFWLH